MNIDEAISLLQKIVDYSDVPNQKRVNLNLVSVDEKPTYEEALRLTRQAVKEGQMSEEELRSRLGL